MNIFEQNNIFNVVYKLLMHFTCRSLSLDGCRQIPFIDTGLLALNSLQGVTALNLQGSCTLTDAGLAAVAQMHALAIVNLQDCRQITGNLASSLADLWSHE